MAYNSVEQHDHDNDLDTNYSDMEHTGFHVHSSSSSPFQHINLQSPQNSLFLESKGRQICSPTNELSQMVQSITSKGTITSGSYDILDEDDYNETAAPISHPIIQPHSQSPTSPGKAQARAQATDIDADQQTQSGGGSPSEPLALHIPRRATASSKTSPISPRSILSTKERAPVVRTASGHSVNLRHPTPNLQTLQGAYVGNIEHLEKTAEKLSMTSSIDDAIRELQLEQKRSDSRRSSIYSQRERESEMPPVSRVVSNASSIVEVNNAARSGGYSPAGYMMSPRSSFSANTRGRSASKSSRFGSRPEPELEGRPLDSFVTSSFPSIRPGNASIAEQDEGADTMTRPQYAIDTSNTAEPNSEQFHDQRPDTAASTNTYDQAEKMFANFDGVHAGPRRPSIDDIIEEEERMEQERSQHESSEFGRTTYGSIETDNFEKRLSVATMLTMPGTAPDLNIEDNKRRMPSGTREALGMIRPQSYADPTTGQDMVYYPAPVPMVLSLPKKLSKNPSSMARNMRRSQVLSHIPQAARQSAIWLPDVLESGDRPPLADDDEAQQMEYIPQHQRMSMGGRRNTQDLEHLPPHLRANAFFELSGHTENVEMKGQSATATLDSILDASADAPVNAFVDHAFAGHLGSEVYGRREKRNTKRDTQLLTPEKPKEKRASFFGLGRRLSSSNLLDSEKEQRQSTVTNALERKPIDDDDDDVNTPLRHSRAITGPTHNLADDDSEEDEGQRDDEEYHGPPTTLLAELQLRKQQQKIRTRPITSMYPNGHHSTLLELDTVAQIQKKHRSTKPVNLAWQTQNDVDPDAEDDEDIPLAMLNVAKTRNEELHRPIGLMEKRDMEDNEPLSRRRARLTGVPMQNNRASTMLEVASPPEVEGETLAQRIRRLKEQGGTATGLPAARPVSGDFTTELMSQFGPDPAKDIKGKGIATSGTPANEEEETLGQRRKRLQAEREAAANGVGADGDAAQRPPIDKRRSMADILSAHPAAGAGRPASYAFSKPTKPAAGLLGLHEQKSQQRQSSMLNVNSQQTSAPNYRHSRTRSGMFDGDAPKRGQQGPQGNGLQPPQSTNYNISNRMSTGIFGSSSAIPQFAQPTLSYMSPNHQYGSSTFSTPYGMGYPNYNMQMAGYSMPNINMQSGMHMNTVQQPPNKGQLDMVERWRQSVMF